MLKPWDEDMRTYMLTLDDVLKNGYVKVRGIEFDCHATAYITRTGTDGALELADLETRSVSVVVYPDSDGRDVETFRVDQTEGWSLWQEDLESEITKIALKEAETSLKWELMEED